jgi:nickel-type superoxide dismutase maturation protease
MGFLGHLFFAFLRRWRRYRVVGNSMRPTLGHGDVVWVDPKAFIRARPRQGEIIVARHPYRTDVRMIKRVTRRLDGDRLLLDGDNRSESTDSETFGPLPATLVLGRVMLGFRKEPPRIYRPNG